MNDLKDSQGRPNRSQRRAADRGAATGQPRDDEFRRSMGQQTIPMSLPEILAKVGALTLENTKLHAWLQEEDEITRRLQQQTVSLREELLKAKTAERACNHCEDLQAHDVDVHIVVDGAAAADGEPPGGADD